MSGMLAVVSLKHRSGLEADRVQNSFAFVSGLAGAPSEFEAANVADSLTEFYSVAVPGAGNVNAFLSPVISRGASLDHTIDVYDIGSNLAGTPHGSPIYSRNFALVNPGTQTALPSELAICVTLEAFGRAEAAVEVGVTRPKQRRTGRIYFGPLETTALDQSTPAPRILPLVRDTLTGAVNRMADRTLAASAGGGVALAVWSRRDAMLRAVQSVSIADDFDIVRRRGEKPLTRTRVAITSSALALGA